LARRGPDGRASLSNRSAMTPPRKPPRPFILVRDRAPGLDAPGLDRLLGAVVAIGNFDGVHRGHRAVVAAALERARGLRRPAAAVTFEPHPRLVLRPGEPLFRLTEAQAKLRLLAATGLDGVLVMTFDAALAALSAETFITRVLVERLAIAGATIGFDFHFGKNRAGSPAFLAEMGRRFGFPVDVMPPLEDEGRPVSSSVIRSALSAGRVVEAAELLGYPWFVTATVIHGDKRGRDLGYPTANIRLDKNCGLKHGIYAVRVGRQGQGSQGDEDQPRFDGVASFGRRPTFDNGAPLLEVFLFDFKGDLYGAALDVAFIGFIREELKFDSVATLVRQMDDDSAKARAALAAAPGAFPKFGAVG
jgi:riboflavin kinase/FMN adenylyltransferase